MIHNKIILLQMLQTRIHQHKTVKTVTPNAPVPANYKQNMFFVLFCFCDSRADIFLYIGSRVIKFSAVVCMAVRANKQEKQKNTTHRNNYKSKLHYLPYLLLR